MAEKKRSRKILIILIILILAGLALPVSNLLVALPSSPTLAAIPVDDPAFAAVRDVLQGKCSHCHTTDAGLPFYASFPLAKSIIQKDVDTGLRYLNLGEGFDATSKAATEVTLAKIEHSVEQNTMPPLPYVAMHWNASLSSADQDAILSWVRGTRVKHYAVAGLPAELQQQVIQPLPIAHAEKAERVTLGETLFNDERLSKDDTISCASCHGLDKGGTDQEAVATGVRDQKGPINSPTVFNAVFNVKQFWDGRAVDLKDQAAGPVTNPLEMDAEWDDVIEKLNKDAALKAAFEKEYPAGFSKDTITDAIAIFEKTLITPNSPFDKFLKGDAAAISDDAKAGYALFKDTGCAACHPGKALGGQSFELMGRAADYFADRGNVQEADGGRFNDTKKESDRHKFKVPTLRNIAITFPYFHDASAKTLDKAVLTMAKYQHGLAMSDEDVAKIVAFLESLTGEYQGKSLKPAKTVAAR